MWVRIISCSLRKLSMLDKEKIPHGKECLLQRFIPNFSEKDQERKLRAAARRRSTEREMEK